MNPDRPFRSVNWNAGMLLTPEQFFTAENYVDENAAWPLEYLHTASGLVGGGVRWLDGEAASASFDPRFKIDHESDRLKVTVSFVRGITPSGRLVEVRDEDRLEQWFSEELTWNFNELYIGIVHTGEKQEDVLSIGADAANESLAAYRHPKYSLKLVTSPHELRHALVISRLRRDARSREYMLDDTYIPPAASVLAHSRLYDMWKGRQDQLEQLALGWAALHSVAVRYVRLLEQWNVAATADHALLAFAERCSFACESGAYDLLDPTMAPQRVFQRIDFVESRIGVALHLVSSLKTFRDLVPEVEQEVERIDAGERPLPSRWRGSDGRRDLAALGNNAQKTLSWIKRLLDAVGERYLDYRKSKVLALMDHVADFANERVYAVVQRVPQAATSEGYGFVFANLDGAPGAYRVVLVGDTQGEAPFGPGPALDVTFTPSHGMGKIRPITKPVQADERGQRNFMIDYESKDSSPFTSLRVESSHGEWFPQAMLLRRVERDAPWRQEVASSQPPQPQPRAATPSPYIARIDR